jgi:hydrogen peroxide-dependent heme synthase
VNATKVEEPQSAAKVSLPAVPLTIEGAGILHQMLRVKWQEWKSLAPNRRQEITNEAVTELTAMERRADGQSAVSALLGHKGDLMLIHFRRTFDELSDAELALARTALWDYLEPTNSYLSVVELGLYESSMNVYRSLADRGIEPESPEWKREVQEVLARQRTAMAPRLWPEMPPHRYISFYPMNRKRDEEKNWYQVPMTERQRMMNEHGLIGRRYAGEVKQIISGSIGFDDWEWGVDLFADDPLVFKKLIYEMRFDEVSAVYALFGAFFVGLRFAAADLGTFLSGQTPAWKREAKA